MRRWLNGCPAHSQQLYKCAEPGEMITEIPPWECIAGGSRRSLLLGVFVCCLSVITSIHHTRPGAPTRNKTSARPQYFILFWYARTRITKTHDVYSGTLRNSQYCQTSCFRACMAHLWVESVQQDEYTFSKNKHSQSCRRLCQCFRRHLNCVKQKVQQYKSNFSNKHVGLWITQACIFANRWVSLIWFMVLRQFMKKCDSTCMRHRKVQMYLKKKLSGWLNQIHHYTHIPRLSYTQNPKSKIKRKRFFKWIVHN